MENNSENNTFPFYNRELSWLDFNERVLEEGLKKDLPLLERFRFLCIVSSNFDEFFRVRVAGIKRELLSMAEQPAAPYSGDLNAAQLMKRVSEKVHATLCRLYDCLKDDLLPALAKEGLKLVAPESFSLSHMDYLESFFISHVYPILTPLRIEEDHDLPSIGSRSMNAAFLLVPESAASGDALDSNSANARGTPAPNSPVSHNEQLVVVRIPPLFSRIIWLPPEVEKQEPNALRWVLLDDVLLIWGSYLFPGYRVKESMLFKINRDADFSVDERRDEDFVEAMAEVLEGRGKSNAVQMIYSPGSPRLRDEFAKRLSLEADDLYEVDGPINLNSLVDLCNITGFDKLKEKPWKIHPASAFSDNVPIWDRINQGDVMLHLPYQSFDPVVRFFREAATDPQVISIKAALYRTGGGSQLAVPPIIQALEQAALNGKQVTALVELKARFDEERNISWANRLERAGVIVVYGLSRLKVHAKVSLVLRHENDRIKRYVHLSTGNYNDKTAKLYEDICIFSCDEEIAYDAGLLFNMLTGYSDVQNMRRLVMAPVGLKNRLLELIERETRRSGHRYSGKIMFKLNALNDPDIINALYRASQTGVQVHLCVRGICTLVPGVQGVSENIRVISVIDYYLEHSRIYYFANGGAEELYLSSADCMPRNLERRVELMFPVQDEKIRAEVMNMLASYFNDNCQAWELKPDGTWKRLQPTSGEKPFRVQKDMLFRAAKDAGNLLPIKPEFTVRRHK